MHTEHTARIARAARNLRDELAVYGFEPGQVQQLVAAAMPTIVTAVAAIPLDAPPFPGDTP